MSVAYGQITLSEINDGINTATIYLYQRSATTPSKPGNPLTYNFSTKTLTGSLGNWSTQISTGSLPCWIIVATASSTEQQDTIAQTEWTDPIKFVENGETPDPINGYNTATVQLYQRSNAENGPSKPNVSTVYTFSSGVLNPVPSNWSRSLPATSTSNSNPCWMTMVSLISQDSSVSIASSSWTDPVKIVENGEKGDNGLNTATINLYQRSANTPTQLPSNGVTYTFITHALSGTLNNWSISVPNGTDPCWIISATVSSAESSATIDSSDWTSPTKLVENGQPGAPGEAASIYVLRVSHAAIAKTEVGAYKPSSIKLDAELHTGAAQPSSYSSGIITIETTTNNQTWSAPTVIGSQVSTATYTIPTNISGLAAIRCSLYMSGTNSNVLLDQHVIPIIQEGYTTTAINALNKATAIYGVCSTQSAVLQKTVSIANFQLYKGAQITVLFEHANTAGNATSNPPVYPTLNVSNTGAKQIRASSITGLTPLVGENDNRNWTDNSLVNFLYNGESAADANGYWIIVDSSALTKIDNILTKVIAGQHGRIDMTNGDFIFSNNNQQNPNSIAYNNTTGVLSITGQINAEGGTIGGFTIGDTAIFNSMTSMTDTTNDGVYIGTNGIALGKGSFKVLKNGTLTATNVTITGEINASSGEIGGFIIDSTSIRSAAKSAVTDGAIALSSNTFQRTINGTSRSDLHFAMGKNFGVKNDGTIYAGNANISGVINATGGEISGDMTVTGKLQGESINVKTTNSTLTSAGFGVLDSSGNSVFEVRPNAPTSSGFSYKGRFNGNLYIDGTAYATGSFASNLVATKALTVESSVIGSTLPTTYAIIDSSGAKIYNKLTTEGSIYTNNKTGATDGVTGCAVGNNGNFYLTSDTNPYIRFFVNNATSTTHSIHATTSALNVDGVQFSPYSANQTVTLVTGNVDFPAHITTSSTAVVIGIPTSLSLADITNVTVTSFNVTLRHVGGGSPYHGTTQISGISSLPSGLTWSAAKAGSNMIRLTLTSSTGFVTTSGGSTKVTNNTPIAASFSDLKVQFT